MAVPDYQTFMLPALQALAAAESLRSLEVAERAADTLGVSAAERELMVGSGKTAIFRSRSGWALTYMKHAGLVATQRRGVYQITDRGRKVLARGLPRIDNTVLNEFEEFRAFLDRSAPKESAPDATSVEADVAATASPEEALESAYDTLRQNLVSQMI